MVAAAAEALPEDAELEADDVELEDEVALDDAALLEVPPAPHAARPKQQAHANAITETMIFLFITSPSISITPTIYLNH